MRVLLICFVMLTAAKVYAQSADVFPSAKHPLPFGMYGHSEHYLSLHPTDTDIVFEHIPRIEGSGVNRFYKRKADGKKGKILAPKDYFAASNGNDVFIAYRGFWQKAVRTDSGYYFISQRAPNEIDQRSFRHFSVGYQGNATDIAAVIEQNRLYKFFYSAQAGKWIPVEPAKRR